MLSHVMPHALGVLVFVLVATLKSASAQSGAPTYHVASRGSDRNDGRTPDAAWQTLSRVNSEPLPPGAKVLFRRGDAWRGQLVPRSGQEGRPVTYAAYGSGHKPLLLGSVAKDDPADWHLEAGNVWVTPKVDRNVLAEPGQRPLPTQWRA